MIPGWKAKRELRRLGYQIRDLPGKIMALPDRIMHANRLKVHDRDFDQIVTERDGAVIPNGKYCIFLIFQPNGIPPSVYLTLEYIRQSGYAIMAIMNSPLLDVDLSRLKDICWKLIERPNFGYDFGGYRDGVRVLSKHSEGLQRLLVMNDSVWFPMSGDPIAMLESFQDDNGFDMAGLNQDQKVRYQKDENHRFELRHLESYFFLISAKTWESGIFRDFWKNYRMSSNKPYTIKHGEIGFSKYMMERGSNVGGLLRREDFVARIGECSNNFLRDTLDYAAYADDYVAQEGAELLQNYSDDDSWRKAALAHIRGSALRRPFNVSFCYAADALFGTTYLKKNSQAYFHRMRQQYLRAVRKKMIAAPAPEILAELEALVELHELAPPKPVDRTL